MKKIVAVALCTATAALTVSCGRISQATQVECVEQISYKEFTPKDQIIPGPKTAAETVSKLFGEDISPILDNPYGTALWEYPSKVNETGEVFTIYEVKDYVSKEPGEKIVFLFEDDTKAALASESDISYVSGEDDEFVDMSWQDVAKANGTDAFAYYNSGASYAIIPEKEGIATSVWVVNSDKHTMNVIWRNRECPIWYDEPVLPENENEVSVEAVNCLDWNP